MSRGGRKKERIEKREKGFSFTTRCYHRMIDSQKPHEKKLQQKMLVLSCNSTDGNYSA